MLAPVRAASLDRVTEMAPSPLVPTVATYLLVAAVDSQPQLLAAGALEPVW